MPDSPSTDNYNLGKGVVYFNQLVSGSYVGERDLGNAPEFAFNVEIEKLEHFSSRGGLKAKDKEVISQITPGVTFTLDEVNKQNYALLTLAEINPVTQTMGVAIAEVIAAAHLDLRSDLAFRDVNHYSLPYDGGTVLFVVGEVVTGATGEGVVVAVNGDATSGTLIIALTTAGFVEDESLSGDIAGIADVNSLTGEVVQTSGDPVILVQDSADTITYVAGTDYEIKDNLKDNRVGRIKFLSGGTIAEDDEIHVTYGYKDASYSEVRCFKETQVEGMLRFVSDNPAGNQQDLEIWRVSLSAAGDTAFIGDDWSTLGFEGEVLKDESGHPDSPYMNIIMS